MKIISSKDNEIVKHIKKLKDKKYRDENNEYIVEGVKLVEEAVKENAPIKKIIICEDTTRTYEIPTNIMLEIARYECIYVTDKIFSSITQVTNPQGIMAIIEKNIEKETIDFSQDIIVMLDDVQDPGNLGTILRTVDSIGLNQILVSKGTADCYNPKVVRSTMGAIFRIKIIECDDIEKTLKECLSCYRIINKLLLQQYVSLKINKAQHLQMQQLLHLKNYLIKKLKIILIQMNGKAKRVLMQSKALLRSL